MKGIRIDQWKYIHYPAGDGKPDRHLAELYNLTVDPDENHNLINDPNYARRLQPLKADLANLLRQTGTLPDKNAAGCKC